ncbi:hypothetical protein MTF65_28995 [Streptomyces sp. APSN-46.1]|uniref:hypothetical protein n=1 Tax=Streptomyces sp. APSN-46.1 TaxID=2929049 RepID=UPI001FB51AE8|nr:hypothetical protein [Streptomyces sp. APSN-46.1]MCJ1681322.1 hypothetical protein [Streptomyces sp. APSN-46.1]
MSAKNATKQLGIGLVGALLAGGLLLAAWDAPEGRPRAGEERTGAKPPYTRDLGGR